jgi:hypothetical protein
VTSALLGRDRAAPDEKFAQLALSFYRVLAPRLGHYEGSARVQSPSNLFSFRLAVAVAEFFASAGPPKAQRAQKYRELGQRKRAAAQQTKRARDVAHQWADRPGMRDAARQEYDRVFAEWLMLQLWQDELRVRIPSRGRPKLEAARALVSTVASIYSGSTGRDWTIVSNPGHEQEHTGPFADLLRALDKDVRLRIKQLRPELIKDWPMSLPRLAKTLRSKNAALPGGSRGDY